MQLIEKNNNSIRNVWQKFAVHGSQRNDGFYSVYKVCKVTMEAGIYRIDFKKYFNPINLKS